MFFKSVVSLVFVIGIVTAQRTCQCGPQWESCVTTQRAQLRANATTCNTQCIQQVRNSGVNAQTMQQLQCVADAHMRAMPLVESIETCMKRANGGNSLGCQVPGQQERDMMTQLQDFMNKYGNRFSNMFSNSNYFDTQSILESAQALGDATEALTRDNAMPAYQNCMQKCFADRAGVSLNIMRTQFNTGDSGSFGTGSNFDFSSPGDNANMPHLNVCANQQNCEFAKADLVKLMDGLMGCADMREATQVLKETCNCMNVDCTALADVAIQMFNNGFGGPAHLMRGHLLKLF